MNFFLGETIFCVIQIKIKERKGIVLWFCVYFEFFQNIIRRLTRKDCSCKQKFYATYYFFSNAQIFLSLIKFRLSFFHRPPSHGLRDPHGPFLPHPMSLFLLLNFAPFDFVVLQLHYFFLRQKWRTESRI